MFKFRENFLAGVVIVTLLALLSLPAYMMFVVYPAMVDLVVAEAETDAREIGSHMANMLLNKSRDAFVITPEIISENEMIMQEFNLQKLKIYSPRGETLFSSDPAEIGQVKDHLEINKKLAQGQAVSFLVEKETRTLEGEVAKIDVVETYLPIIGNDTYLGAFELYYDITPHKAKLNRLVEQVKRTVGFVIVGLLIALVLSLLRASKSISARMHVEEKAAELSESRFRELFNNMGSGVVVLEARNQGKNFMLLDINNSAERFDNLKKEKVVGKDVNQVFSWCSELGLCSVLQGVWQSGLPAFRAVVMPKEDGSLFGRECYFYKLSSGEIVVIYDDVSARVEAERRLQVAHEELERRVDERTHELSVALESLRKSHEFHKTVLDSMNDAVSIIDTRNFRIVGANSVFLRDYNLQLDDVIGRKCYELTHKISQPCEPPDDPCPLKHTMETGEHASEEHIHYLPSGERIFVEVSSSPIFDDSGKVIQVVHVAKDISTRKEAEYELRRARQLAEEANQAKSVFLAKVSHELRTPLNGIMGFAELIMHSAPSQDVPGHARLILSESEVLLQIINELLDHAKIEAKKVELESLPFDLYELLQRTAASMKLSAEKKGIDFSWSLDPDIFTRLVGDPTRLRQIFVNLIGNAVKFTSQGSVTVKGQLVEDLDDKVLIRFSVTDTGIGIPPEKKDTIFESFVQVDGSTTRKYGGTGLGTTIAKHLVELMGGEIGFDSEPGRGSTFWCQLAIEKRYSEKEEFSSPAEVEEMSSQGRMLVVDDYMANQQLARFHLESVGFEVDIAENGRDAVALFEKNHYDLILMDIHMPEMDGYEATKEIRRRGFTMVPIIALTANASEEDRQKCLDSGMNDVVTKPFRRKSFLEAVNKWMQQKDNSAEEPAPPAVVQGEVAESEAVQPIAYEQAAVEFQGEEKILNQVIKVFLENVGKQVTIIQQAIDGGDRETVRKEAHAIKGGAGNLCADPLAGEAKNLEMAAGDGEVERLQEILIKMQAEYIRLQNFMDGRSRSS